MPLLLSSSQSTQASRTRDKRIETFSDSFPTLKGDPLFSVAVNDEALLHFILQIFSTNEPLEKSFCKNVLKTLKLLKEPHQVNNR